MCVTGSGGRDALRASEQCDSTLLTVWDVEAIRESNKFVGVRMSVNFAEWEARRVSLSLLSEFSVFDLGLWCLADECEVLLSQLEVRDSSRSPKAERRIAACIFTTNDRQKA